MALRSSWLPALAVFASAARQQNFAHAADELHLTASAVSHHVRRLETLLGVALFQRHARGVSLTPEGRLLADAAGSALAELEAVVGSLRKTQRQPRVRVTVLPSLAACWLVPRLARFAAIHPEIRLTIDTERALTRFDAGGPDLGLRYGPGRWPGLSATLLMDETLYPAAAPLLPGAKRVRTAAQIAKLPLVADLGLEGWREWFRHAGVTDERPSDLTSFGDSADALTAAVAGVGAVLARQRLAALHLAAGRLMRLPGPAMTARYSYYVVHPAQRRLSAEATALVAWLQQEARNDAAPPAATS